MVLVWVFDDVRMLAVAASPEGLTGAGRCDFKVAPSHGCQVTVGC